MKGPKRKGSGLKNDKNSSRYFSDFPYFFQTKVLSTQDHSPQHFFIKTAFSSGKLLSKCHGQLYSAASVAVETFSRLQSINNSSSAKSLLAYPAKEPAKSGLPRVFTCQAGGASKSLVTLVGLQHFPGRVTSCDSPFTYSYS